MSTEHKLVFDIETIGKDFTALDDMSQEYLLQYAQDDQEREEIKEHLGFYPLTGEIVAIGILNPDTHKGCVFTQKGSALVLPKKIEEITEADIAIEEGTEKEILEKFWHAAEMYHTFISFNGRGFDVPYLMVRSAIHQIRPSKDLMSNRYLSSQYAQSKHIDLFDQLSFYGAVRRKFSLHMWSKAFGIKSPKEGGTTGDDVGKLFHEGHAADIARYNAGDLLATAALYAQWESYMRF